MGYNTGDVYGYQIAGEPTPTKETTPVKIQCIENKTAGTLEATFEGELDDGNSAMREAFIEKVVSVLRGSYRWDAAIQFGSKLPTTGLVASTPKQEGLERMLTELMGPPVPKAARPWTWSYDTSSKEFSIELMRDTVPYIFPTSVQAALTAINGRLSELAPNCNFRLQASDHWYLRFATDTQAGRIRVEGDLGRRITQALADMVNT